MTRRQLIPLALVALVCACGVRDPQVVDDPEDTGPMHADMGPDADVPVVPPDMSSDMTSEDAPVVDMTAEDAATDTSVDMPDPPPDMLQSFTFELGPREEPFEPWTDGGDLPVVEGIQGGYHTEHMVGVDSRLTADELNEAQVTVSVESPDTTLASGVWVFFDTQWSRGDDDTWHVEIPQVVMEDRMPHYDTDVTVSAEIELVDGRTETFTVDLTTVAQQ